MRNRRCNRPTPTASRASILKIAERTRIACPRTYLSNMPLRKREQRIFKVFFSTASIRSAVICFIALLVLFAWFCGMSRDALASTGCNAVNTGGFNVSAGAFGNKTIVGFAVGDNVTFTITWSGNGSWLFRTATFIELDDSPISATSGSQTRSYTVTGNNQDTTLIQFTVDGPTVTASCTAAATAPTITSISPTSGSATGSTSATSAADQFTYSAAAGALLVPILPRADPRRRTSLSRPTPALTAALRSKGPTSTTLRR
jgi:hypothetical protein